MTDRTKERGGGVLEVREAAAMLGMSIKAVKKLPAPELPFFRVGSRGDRRYMRADVERYIERRMVRR